MPNDNNRGNEGGNNSQGKSNRGFASMPKDKVKEISRMGHEAKGDDVDGENDSNSRSQDDDQSNNGGNNSQGRQSNNGGGGNRSKGNSSNGK